MSAVAPGGVVESASHDHGSADNLTGCSSPHPLRKLLTGQLRIWLNGRLYDDPHQATVAGTDHGLVVGDGVFETLKVTERGAFAVRRHLNRLTRSAAALGLPAT